MRRPCTELDLDGAPAPAQEQLEGVDQEALAALLEV